MKARDAEAEATTRTCLHTVEATAHERPATTAELLQAGIRHTQASLDCKLVGKHFPRGQVARIGA